MYLVVSPKNPLKDSISAESGESRYEAAVAAVKRELGSARAAAGVVLLQCGIAWVIAFLVHTVGTLLGFV